jgi:hypothetical protein
MLGLTLGKVGMIGLVMEGIDLSASPIHNLNVCKVKTRCGVIALDRTSVGSWNLVGIWLVICLKYIALIQLLRFKHYEISCIRTLIVRLFNRRDIV